MKILVVDDLLMMRRMTRKLLRELGHTDVVEADDGTTALPMLKAGDIDFLITDWDMPGMPGIDLIRAVRSDPSLCDLPVLMVTSEARPEHVVAAEAAGANGYFEKPYTLETLRNHLTRIAERLVAA